MRDTKIKCVCWKFRFHFCRFGVYSKKKIISIVIRRGFFPSYFWTHTYHTAVEFLLNYSTNLYACRLQYWINFCVLQPRNLAFRLFCVLLLKHPFKVQYFIYWHRISMNFPIKLFCLFIFGYMKCRRCNAYSFIIFRKSRDLLYRWPGVFVLLSKYIFSFAMNHFLNDIWSESM